MNGGLLEVRLKLQGTLLIDFKHQLPKFPTLAAPLEMAKDWAEDEEDCKATIVQLYQTQPEQRLLTIML